MNRTARAERSESELVILRKLAVDFAAGRKETPTTVHLLAAISSRPGAGAELLHDRGLDKDTVLKAGRSFDEELADAIGKALADARDIAKRTRGSVSTDAARDRGTLSPDSRLSHVEPSGVHVLVTLLADRGCAAHRALVLSGVDVTRLRAVALARASGFVAARRVDVRAQAPVVVGAPKRAGDAAVVPLLPRPAAGASPAPAAQPASRAAPPARRSDAPPPPSLQSASMPPPRRALKRSEAAQRGKPDAGPTPLLDALDRAARGRLPSPVVKREELELRALDVIGKHSANAPCLTGPAGVGKTTIARSLGLRLSGSGRRVVEVAPGALLSGAAARGAVADRLAALFDEARGAGGVVLFFDDVHELLGSGDEAALEIKAELARGDVQMILATSPEGHRRYVESDPQIGRRLVTLEVEEPDEEAAFAMVRVAVEHLARHHDVTYDDACVTAAIAWSVRYLPGRALPDKAISALDLAGARARRIAPEARARGGRELTVEVVAEVVAELGAVPVERLLQNDRERLLGLERALRERVVGHASELARIALQLRKSGAGLRHDRPLGSFLLLGPTGVGKTETAKAMAHALFGSMDALTRIDLSEFAESHSLARLIGAPPGYVGHEAGGQLTEAVRKRPYQVVLLDEVEKAHPEVLLAFLQVLDEGRMTDGRGRRVDFTNVVVAMTSNLGAREIAAERRGARVGFTREDRSETERLRAVAITEAKRHLPLELYGRIDEILFFAPLGRADVGVVAERQLSALVGAMAQRGVSLDVGEGVVDALLDAGGFDPELGARPLRRVIAQLIEAPIADLLLSGEVATGGAARVEAVDGRVSVLAGARGRGSELRPRAR